MFRPNPFHDDQVIAESRAVFHYHGDTQFIKVRHVPVWMGPMKVTSTIHIEEQTTTGDIFIWSSNVSEIVIINPTSPSSQRVYRDEWHSSGCIVDPDNKFWSKNDCSHCVSDLLSRWIRLAGIQYPSRRYKHF